MNRVVLICAPYTVHSTYKVGTPVNIWVISNRIIFVTFYICLRDTNSSNVETSSSTAFDMQESRDIKFMVK
jgi:hypothetical protein